MKHLILIFAILLFGCKGKRPEIGERQPDPNNPRNVRTSSLYNEIDFDSAALLISNFLKVPALHAAQDKFILGGYIETNFFNGILKSDTYLPNDTPVVKFYPCYRRRTFKDEVFIAYKTMLHYNPQSLHQCDIDPEDLDTISINHFSYDRAGTVVDNVKDFLAEMRMENDHNTETINAEEIQTYARLFNIYYRSGNIGNSFLCGGMVKEEIQKLLEQQYMYNGKLETVEGLRYFFGYDTRRNCNPIRLILFAVTRQGANLLTDYQHQNAYIMEHAWPPECN
jgi:hypothetical protein